jgi:vancomycin resistance protein VanW
MLSEWHPWLYRAAVAAHRTRRRVQDRRSHRWAAHRPEVVTDTLVAEAASPLQRRLAGVDEALQRNKRHNLELAIAGLDGQVLLPGELLSFWRCVGNPTAGRGYVPGMVLAHGRIRAGVGGGLCQLSNMLHWLSLHTALTVVERHHHGHDLFPDDGRLVPFGTGATVFYNYLDLRLRNPGPETYRIHLWLTEVELRGEIRADRPPRLMYEVVEEGHRFARTRDGLVRENTLFRVERDRSTGALAGRHLLAHNVFPVLYEPGPGVTIAAAG